MSLAQVLDKIDKSPLSSYGFGTADTVGLFFESFVIPRLPDRDTVLKWNTLLLRYVDDPDAIFAIRAFSNWSDAAVESVKDDELRRGFMTVSHKGQENEIRYFFTDNHFAAYFAKMVADGFCPEYDEFKQMMIDRTFPARFGRSCRLELEKAAYNIGSKDPHISSSGYKIAHIVDAGEHYLIESGEYTITELSTKYGFPRGYYSDWKLDNEEKIYLRNYNLAEKAREVLVAHFLRFVHPFNYILVPKGAHKGTIYNRYIHSDGTTKNDIAEYEPLLMYAHEQFIQIYGDAYREYLRRVLIHDDYFKYETDPGKVVINIEYGCPLLVGSAPSKNVSSSHSEQLVKSFLLEGKSFRALDSEILGLKNPKGFVAMTEIKRLGISSDMKGKMTEQNIDDFIQKASPELRQYLIVISKSFTK